MQPPFLDQRRRTECQFRKEKGNAKLPGEAGDRQEACQLHRHVLASKLPRIALIRPPTPWRSLGALPATGTLEEACKFT